MRYSNIISTATRWCAGLFVMGLMTLGSVQAQSTHVVVKGNVFGGGNAAAVSGNTSVLMQGNAQVENSVYGGGALANTGTDANKTTTVTIEGGTVGTDGDGNGYVFGGALGDASNAPTVGGTVTVNIGTEAQMNGSGNNVVIKGGVFGCNNAYGSPSKNVTVHIWCTGHDANNTTASTDTFLVNYALPSVFGGGNNAAYIPANNTMKTKVWVHGCDNTIYAIYGGGNAADVGASGGVQSAVDVEIDGGRHNWVFGGGNGAGVGNPGANIYGNGLAAAATLTVHAGLINHIFGGSNERGTIVGVKNMQLLGDGTCAQRNIAELYGGNNKADGESAALTVACPDSPSKLWNIANVYGGSRAASLTGDVVLTINGGNIDAVYGGNNVSGTIGGNVTVNIYGGTLDSVFGGNNVAGSINGLITVNIDSSNACPLVLGNVYGGGNLALYNPTADDDGDVTVQSPRVNLINGTVQNNVFGGGRGDVTGGNADKGKVTAHPQVSMTFTNAASDGYPGSARVFRVLRNIYGGGEMATVDGTPVLNITTGTVGPSTLVATDIDGGGDVYGGGLGKAGDAYTSFANVNNTTVNIGGTAWVRGSVFGGGENGHVLQNTDVNVSGGTVGVRIPYTCRAYDPDGADGATRRVYAGNVYGGGRGVDHISNTDYYSETAGRVYGNTDVSISGGNIRHAVYGGGSLASVGTYTLTESASVYGGHLHNFSENTGNAVVTVSGGRIGPLWTDLEVDEAGEALVSGNVINTSYSKGGKAGAIDTIAKYYKCLGQNEGMVYGSGRGVNYDFDEVVEHDHTHYIEMAFTNNTTVTVSGTADVVGCVFGGGENGHVKGDTEVDIEGGVVGGMRLHHNGFFLPNHDAPNRIYITTSNDDELGFGISGVGMNVFRGNVYGGGRGVDHTQVTSGSVFSANQKEIFSISAGRVYGNTEVNITGGTVYHNVFGGGSIASVGTYNYPQTSPGVYDFLESNPENAVANTGKTTVNVTGGQVGVMGENEGGVYGGGRGIAGASEAQVTHLAFVNETEVNIGTGTGTHADVRGSVFGGGMNGHVLGNTDVEVTGGVIGGKTAGDYGSYDSVYFPADKLPASPDYTINGVNYYSGIHWNDTITTTEGVGPRTVFLGNVYGGGRGVDAYDGTHNSYTAGRVYGNTNVTISGGVIYHSVFGGGSIASVGTYEVYTASDVTEDGNDAVGHYRIQANQPKVLDTSNVVAETGHHRNEYIGKATVLVNGGRIGTNGRNNGRVFGSSRGMAGVNYLGLGYVNIAHVTITGSADVRGSVFGSGENGHVLDSTLVTVSGGHVGNGKRNDADAWTNHYIGNVYGGGRGLDRAVENASTVSPFAGRVYKSANVVVTGGQIDHNVYGGGSLASVGRFKRNNDNEITYNDPDKGFARVTISGGTIGLDGDENGHVFGASRGTAVAYQNSDIRANLAYVAGTRVNVSNGTIKGSVFGGGESGHVQRDARVNVSGGTIGSEIPSDYNAMSDANKKKYDLMGNVYGAGRGIDECQYNANYGYSMSAGYVRGRTIVTITGTPTIHRNVYGGGSMGSVGDYGPYCRLDYWQGAPTTFVRGTEAENYLDASNGVATVVIKGTVGTANDVARHYGGNVYGSCRGMANDPSHDPIYDVFYAYHGGFGEMAYVTGSHVIVETGANVKGNVYGGGENGHVDFGGTEVMILNGRVDGNVFGGGKGSSTSPTAGIVDGPTHVSIGTEAQGNNTPDANGSYNTVEIGGYVFGGNDSYSSPLGTMTVDVWHTKHTAANRYPTLPVRGSYGTDEEYQTAYDAAVAALKTESNASPDANYALKGVYGGGNEADVLSGIATVDASDGNAAHVYDQRYIDQRIVQSAADIPPAFQTWPGGISRKSVVNIHGCDENTIKYVYGGGKAATTIENVVNIEGGRIYQVFAGGDGSAEGTHADVGHVDGSSTLRTITGNSNHGNATVTVEGGIVYQVFGGSNTRGKVYGTTNVGFEPDDECLLVNADVFGGGNQAEGQGDIVVTIPCGVKLGTVYGCANQATHNGNVTLNIEGGDIYRVFGGSRDAQINGNVTVNVYGGSIEELFGGNNVSGNITGTIEVNVDWGLNSCNDPLFLGYVYGGGRQAPYEPTGNYGAVTSGTVEYFSPVVNIIQATVDTAVFGGGFGEDDPSAPGTKDAHVNANPKVVIGAYRVKDHAGNTIAEEPNNPVRIGTAKNELGRTLAGNVFGSGNAGPVLGSPQVVIQGSDTKVWHNVYGGGNAAMVKGNPDIQIGIDPRLSKPTFTVDPTSGELTLSSHENADIHYTSGASPADPTNAEAKYEGAISGTEGNTYKAVAYKADYPAGYQTSTVATLTLVRATTPTITYSEGNATISATGADAIYYTTDGSDPDITDPAQRYTTPVALSSGSTINAVAVKEGCLLSTVATYTAE